MDEVKTRLHTRLKAGGDVEELIEQLAPASLSVARAIQVHCDRDCGLMLVQDLGDVKTSLARLLKLVETMATRLEGLRHQFQGVKLYEVRIL